jgi:hypothetical protein
MTGWMLHLVIGLVFAATGFAVRSACDHRGWLPHPTGQVTLTVVLVTIESTIAYLVVG